MSAATIRQYVDRVAVEGVLGGVVIAAVLVGGYLFAWDVAYVGPDSPWGIGQFGAAVMFLDGGLNLWFLLLPGFIVSTIVYLFRWWRGRVAAGTTDRQTLVLLVLVPLAIGALVGVSFSALPLFELLSSPSLGALGELLAFLLFALVFIAIHALYMAVIIGVGVVAGYLLVTGGVAVFDGLGN